MAVNQRLMLDTNAVSLLLKIKAGVMAKLIVQRRGCISAITEAEMHFGMARRKLNPDTLRIAERFLDSIDILPWTSDCARRYGSIRADLERVGRPLATLDMLIAAHAVTENCTLVTSDKVFAQVPGLEVLHSANLLS